MMVSDASDEGTCNVQGAVLADLCCLVNYAKHSSYQRLYVITLS